MEGIIHRIRYSFWTFIVLYLIYCFTHGIQGSYTASVLTSLEKKFHLSSSLSGLLVTIASVGYFVSALIIPYYFGRKHRVRLFAICMLSTGVCGLLYTIPHFLYVTDDEVYTFQTNFSNSNTSGGLNLCFPNEAIYEHECDENKIDSLNSDVKPNYVAMSLFCLSEIVHGVAGASLWTVGMAFIDDNSSVELSSKLIGIMFLMRFISPVLAFGFGSVFLSLHNTLKPTSLTPDHPKWLGAWWLGYFFCFIVNTLISIPTFFLPENFKRNISQDDATRNEGDPNLTRRMSFFETNVRELWRKSVRIVKNPVFTISSVAVSLDCYIYAFYAFLPKYMEVHYIQASWMASLLGGMIPCLAGGFMSYYGGVVSGKFKPGSDQGVSKNVLFSWIMSFVDTVLFLFIMFIPCSQSYLPFGYDQEISKVQLNQTCNMGCGCTEDIFDPICGSDDLWYVSPCHAGCSSSFLVNGSNMFANCSCIGNESQASIGMCDQSCLLYLIIYVIMITMVTAINSSYNVPLTNVILKCVHETDKSLALGIQTLFICVTMFPSTIIFGRLLDMTCIHWSSHPCTETTGSCLAYDHRKFRFVLHGFTFACRIISTLFYGLNYKYAVKIAKGLKDKETQMNDLEKQESTLPTITDT